MSPGHAYANEPSTLSNAESLEEALNNVGTAESEVLKLMLKRGASEDSAPKNTSEPSPKMANVVNLVIDVDTIKQNALHLGFAVDFPGPPNLKKAKTDPGGKSGMPQSLIGHKRHGETGRVGKGGGMKSSRREKLLATRSCFQRRSNANFLLQARLGDCTWSRAAAILPQVL